MAWVFMRHAETGGETRVPGEPGVVDWHEAHGWERSEEPPQLPFVPSPATDPGEAWVELVHPGINARHDFPNNPAAIAGALEVGWQVPGDRAGQAGDEGEQEGQPQAGHRHQG